MIRIYYKEIGYSRYYETSEAGTPIFRAIPIEESIRCGQKTLIKESETEDLVMTACPCRTRAEKPGDRECKDKFPIAPSNFIPVTDANCIGLCAERCFFGALEVDKDTKKVKVEPEKYLGCGVCTFGCKNDTLRLERLDRSTPFESVGKLMKAFQAENKKINV